MTSRRKTGFIHVERDNKVTAPDWDKNSLQRGVKRAYQDIRTMLEDKYDFEIDQLIVVNSYTISLRFKAEYRF